MANISGYGETLAGSQAMSDKLGFDTTGMSPLKIYATISWISKVDNMVAPWRPILLSDNVDELKNALVQWPSFLDAIKKGDGSYTSAVWGTSAGQMQALKLDRFKKQIEARLVEVQKMNRQTSNQIQSQSAQTYSFTKAHLDSGVSAPTGTEKSGGMGIALPLTIGAGALGLYMLAKG